MTAVVRATPQDVLSNAPRLLALLQEAVDGGAGLGFTPPIGDDEGLAYWRTVADDVASRKRVVLLANLGGAFAGTAQLDLCQRTNGLHRAEVQKVIVDGAFRRRGIGRALMQGIDDAARAEGRTTLYLDTFSDQGARRLYESCGWTHAGDIPAFARTADGALGATSIYYKLL